jgi:hypothetical protein
MIDGSRPVALLRPELRRRGGRRALAWEEVLTRFETRHAGKGRPGA